MPCHNHASISLSDDLSQMYSFGRVHPYNPFWGGFVMESPDAGTFKSFSKTKAVVLSVKVSKETYAEIQKQCEGMYLERGKYHYNYLGLGLGLAAFHIDRKKENCYYCSEFVKDILTKYHIEGAEELQGIVQPVHFLDLPYTPVYCGELSEYAI